MKTLKYKKAMAMIELIFAIVVMAIVLMSAPRLIATANQSGFVAIQQESINEASSRLNMILGYHWDEQDADENFYDPILICSASSDSNLSEYNNTARRIGTPKESTRSFVRDDGKEFNATAPSDLGLDIGETIGNEDDIDDFHGSVISLKTVELNPNADYVEKGGDINISTTVSYISDNIVLTSGTYENPGADKGLTFDLNPSAVAGETNIKYIRTTLQDISNVEELNKTITLNAFSCNIGSYKLEKRSF